MIVLYGGPSVGDWPSPRSPETIPTSAPFPQPVYDEEVHRQLRELREMVKNLQGERGGESVTAIDVVRRTVEALIQSHPDAIDTIEAVCADARKNFVGMSK